MVFGNFKQWLLDLLFPKACFGCKSRGMWLCNPCQSGLHAVPPSCFVCHALVPGRGRIPAGRTCKTCRKQSDIYAFYSPFLFRTPVIREMIHGLKYQKTREVAEDLGALLSSYWRLFGPAGVKIWCVPVPLHPARERTRGFNQAERISFFFAPKAQISILTNGMTRVAATKPQIGLSGKDRLANLAGAMKVTDPRMILGKDILLLDDVRTTGATLEEAARALKEAGARRIWAMTVAH